MIKQFMTMVFIAAIAFSVDEGIAFSQGTGGTGGTGNIGGGTGITTGNSSNLTGTTNTTMGGTSSGTSGSNSTSATPGVPDTSLDISNSPPIANNRNQGFVGATGDDLANNGFVGAPSNTTGGAGGGQGGGAGGGAGGRRGAGGAAGSQNYVEVVRQNVRAVLVNLIQVQPTSNAQVESRFQNSFSRLPQTMGVVGYSLKIENGTALLTGTVTDQNANDRIVQMLRLEPGVYKIDNQLQLAR